MLPASCWLLACISSPVEHSVDPVTAPPGFDIEGCAHIEGPTVPDAGAAAQQQCGACCLEGGHHDNSFILDNGCVCASLLALDTDHDVCGHTVSNTECEECCDGSGFAHSNGPIGDCYCLGRDDESSCDDVFGYDDPVAACAACCVEVGYLGFEFDLAYGREICTCTR